MGDIVRTGESTLELSVSVVAGSPVERVDILRGADLVQTLRTYGAEDLGTRVRVYWQGAEYRGRGRNTHWTGAISVENAIIERMTPVNHWNHERLLEPQGPHRVVFEAVTSGNFGGADLSFSEAGALLVVETNLVSGSVGLTEMGLEDVVFDAGGLDRQIRLRRLPDAMDTCALERTITIPLLSGCDNPVWVRVTTSDGHQAWSSPIYALT